MAKEKPESELNRLRTEQRKTRQDEVFGGLSPAELAAYDGKTKRIDELETALAATADAKKTRQHASADQRREWNKESETDTPHGEARQPYRGRETSSADSSKDATKTWGKAKSKSDENDSE